MKNVIKGFFSRDKKDTSRELTHPSQLKAGDLLKLDDSFLLPEMLMGQMYTVVEVNTYQFEFEHYPEWVLKNERGEVLFITLEDEDGEDMVNFSIKIERSVVESLFDMDEFAEIFEDEGTTLNVQGDKAGLEKWLDSGYHQTSQAKRGYFYSVDYRGSSPPDDEDCGEPFDTFELESEDGLKGLGIEIWSTGETDVYLSICRPISDIRELWPK
ncbi:MAG: hypothetical protein COB04_00145 [Gammaproteobacteria bacterium]|nr:MAG: hypothetical protein COB04_00145 [Gammaproteobacteria bacterium]